MAIEPLEQSTVLSEDKRQADRPQRERAIPVWIMLSADCESALPRALPKFYEFAQLTAPHPTRLTAPQLPPEQHIGVGGTYHGKIHV